MKRRRVECGGERMGAEPLVQAAVQCRRGWRDAALSRSGSVRGEAADGHGETENGRSVVGWRGVSRVCSGGATATMACASSAPTLQKKSEEE